jgi:hypothetical protein
VEKKKWAIVKGGLMVLGEKPDSLPKYAFVSLTRGEGLNFAQLVINQVFTLLVMNQMKKTPGLLYAEVEGELKRGKGYGQTMTVWDGKTMPQLRNSGSHGFAMKFFGWVIHRKNTQTFYLTYKANGNIPTKDQANEILKEFGKFYDRGVLVRKATPPNLDGIIS